MLVAYNDLQLIELFPTEVILLIIIDNSISNGCRRWYDYILHGMAKIQYRVGGCYLS